MEPVTIDQIRELRDQAGAIARTPGNTDADQAFIASVLTTLIGSWMDGSLCSLSAITMEHSKTRNSDPFWNRN